MPMYELGTLSITRPLQRCVRQPAVVESEGITDHLPSPMAPLPAHSFERGVPTEFGARPDV
jgi:hypothetical protein